MIKDTSKEGAGNALTHWGTPPWCTEGLLDHWPELLSMRVLEPEAGAGNIAEAYRACVELGGHGGIMDAIEIRDGCVEHLRGLVAGDVRQGDFLQPDLFGEGPQYGGIIMNPPYRPPYAMLRHVKRAFEVVAPGGIIAALLPLSFLSGGSGRNVFWGEYPAVAQLLFFDTRPAFDEQGGMFEPAWFVWNLANGSPPRAPVMIEAPRREHKTFAW